jgi:hypothetical protein
MGTGSECTREVPVPISEADRVTLGQTKGTGTSLRSGASSLWDRPRGQALRCAREPVPSGTDQGDRHFAALGSQFPLGQTKGTGTSLRLGASPLGLAQSENETALPLPARNYLKGLSTNPLSSFG